MKKAVASVVIGAVLWFVLMVIHEEWQQYQQAGWAGPPPFNPFNLWTPAALIAAIWASLAVFMRWAYRQLEEPLGKKR